MSSNREFMERRLKAVPKGIGSLCSFYIEKAKNAEMWDIEGNRYIDFAGGIGVLNTGHLHNKVQLAVKKQLEKFSHTCIHVAPYSLYVEVAEKINQAIPIEGEVKTAFFTTGAEAVENAIKVARHATGRSAVIAFNHAFHGRTNLTLALTGKVAPYKIGYGPFANEIYHSAYPNALHGVSIEEALHSLTTLLKVDVDANRVAAIIIEPVQGEGGFNVTPDRFLQALRKLCDEHGIVLIFDEVQCGFARTGTLFASENFSVKPDLITMAKSLAGGFPLSALAGKAALMDSSQVGGLGGTYTGNPLALAAADAVLDVINEEQLCQRSLQLGAKLTQFISNLQPQVPQIKEVRGLGSMIAVEFMTTENKPDAEFAKKVQSEALKRGLILLTCGPYYNVVRFLYPLTIEDTVFSEALDKLSQAILAS